jgi:hypothetical protein
VVELTLARPDCVPMAAHFVIASKIVVARLAKWAPRGCAVASVVRHPKSFLVGTSCDALLLGAVRA